MNFVDTLVPPFSYVPEASASPQTTASNSGNTENLVLSTPPNSAHPTVHEEALPLQEPPLFHGLSRLGKLFMSFNYNSLAQSVTPTWNTMDSYPSVDMDGPLVKAYKILYLGKSLQPLGFYPSPRDQRLAISAPLSSSIVPTPDIGNLQR